MEIQSKNPSTVEHGKANLPDLGIVELSVDGIVDVPEDIAMELLANSPESWGLVGEPIRKAVVEVGEINSDQAITSPMTAKYQDIVLDEADMENNPLLSAFGLKVGDEIGVPVDAIYTPDFSEDETQEIPVNEEKAEEDEKAEEAQENRKETEEEKASRLAEDEEEEVEMKKQLLKKNMDALRDMAAGLELPQADYQNLNKSDLVNLLLVASKEAE